MTSRTVGVAVSDADPCMEWIQDFGKRYSWSWSTRVGVGAAYWKSASPLAAWRLNKAEPMPVAGDAVVGASSICPPSASPLAGWIIKAIGLEVENVNEPTSTWWDS
jgi:hypothetical protein